MRTYHKKSEFYCQCHCGLCFSDMDMAFVLDLNIARGYAKVPFNFTSTIRCEKHNKDVGGSDTSSHLIGCAADIEAKTSHIRYRILYGLMKAGITRFKIYPIFIHADKDPNKPKELISI